MRLGVDYLPASRHAPGIGRYARELVRALVTQPGDHELRLLEFGRGPAVVDERALGLHAASCPVRRSRWPLPRRLLGWPGADTLLGGVDLFHHVLVPPPAVRRARQSLTLSELPPPEHAEVIRALDAVFVFSRWAADELQRGIGVDAARVHVLPVGCDHWRRELGDAAGPAAAAVPPTILVLGAPRTARHPALIVEAWRLLRERGLECRLRFLGGRGEALPVTDDGTLTHALPGEPALPAELAAASLLVHLSEVEATAVTPLEAFSFGLPVVANDLPAFREALDDEATLCPLDELRASPSRLADALAEALAGAGDEPARARREAVAAQFTWAAHARAALAGWRGLLRA